MLTKSMNLSIVIIKSHNFSCYQTSPQIGDMKRFKFDYDTELLIRLSNLSSVIKNIILIRAEVYSNKMKTNLIVQIIGRRKFIL
jgi:hypothetical protein